MVRLDSIERVSSHWEALIVSEVPTIRDGLPLLEVCSGYSFASLMMEVNTNGTWPCVAGGEGGRGGEGGGGDGGGHRL